MFKAHIIEIDGSGVGLAVGDEVGFTFFSSGGRFDVLDASVYPDLPALARAVRIQARSPHRLAAPPRVVLPLRDRDRRVAA